MLTYFIHYEDTEQRSTRLSVSIAFPETFCLRRESQSRETKVLSISLSLGLEKPNFSVSVSVSVSSF